jgi:hypothetical protein
MPTTVTARISDIFTGNSWCAGSAYPKVTFIDDRSLQLSCDYYSVYNLKLLVMLCLAFSVCLRCQADRGLL